MQIYYIINKVGINLKIILNFAFVLKKKKHKLHIDYDYDYTLIVIKSALKDFRLAYHLNQEFNLQLKKERFTLNIQDKDGKFSVFSYDDPCRDQYWALITNKQTIQKKEDSNSLFDEMSNTFTLISEEKNADYFLKIENNTIPNTILIQRINAIHKVITSYEIDPNNFKSKNCLIF